MCLFVRFVHGLWHSALGWHLKLGVLSCPGSNHRGFGALWGVVTLGLGVWVLSGDAGGLYDLLLRNLEGSAPLNDLVPASLSLVG